MIKKCCFPILFNILLKPEKFIFNLRSTLLIRPFSLFFGK